MKSKPSYLLSGIFSLLFFFFLLQQKACKETPDTNTSIDSLPVAVTGVNGEQSVVVPATGKQLFIKVSAPESWALSTASGDSWLTIETTQGKAGVHQVKISVSPNTTAQREAQIRLSTASKQASLSVLQQAGDTPSETEAEIIKGDPSLLEVPKLSQEKGDYFITHRVGDLVTYSVEYSTVKHHARWVCFSFTNATAAINTSRTDQWSWDPEVPSRYEVFRSDFDRGFSRGHLVASHDRVYSEAANKQTFYYTNISPQRNNHNTGIWQQLEKQVQDWGRNQRFRDVMYVAKGGTIADHQIEDKLSAQKLVVPQYYWMAVLVEKNGKYKAIAFWTEHKKPETVSRLSSVAIPVRVLEQRTGLDLFHNLPDAIEEAVETAQPTKNLADWPGI